MEKRSIDLTFESSNSENRIIEGYASKFEDGYTSIRDSSGEVFYERIVSGAFNRSLNSGRDILMLVNHDYNKVVGRSGNNLMLTEDEVGLRFTLEVPNTTDGNDLLENVRCGIIRGCSFGFNVTDENIYFDGGNMYRDIKDVNLFEITATATPAYASTELSVRSMMPTEEKQEANIQHIDNDENIERSTKILSAFFNAFID